MKHATSERKSGRSRGTSASTRAYGRLRRIGAVALGASLLAFAAAPSSAQSSPQAADTSFATLVGQVVSATTGKPLQGAVVMLRGSGGGALTDSTGNFRIPKVPAGQDTIEIRYIGYETSDTPIELRAERTTHIVLLLGRTVVRVADLRVEVPADRRGKMAEFERRRRAGHGYYLGPEEIENRKPLRLVSDIFRGVPGVYVGLQQHGRQPVFIERGRRCKPLIYLDGVLMRVFEIDDIAPEELGAIEVYRGPSEIPGEFLHPSNDCGAIAIWTPAGGVTFQ